MPGKSKDNLTGDLFPSEELRPGEEIDAKGDVYDERGLLVREAPSPELVEARERVRRSYPDIEERDPRFNVLAKFYLREIKNRQKKNKSR